jgi:hypothetical protein
MESKSVWKLSMMVSYTMVVCGLLAFSGSAVAQSSQTPGGVSEGNARCSNKTIKGDYGCSIHGSLIFGPTQLPFVLAGLEHNDGNGNTKGLEHAVVDGNSSNSGWDPNIATYTVNPDCTGKSLTYSPPDNPDPITNYFVVVDNGKQIYKVNGQHALSIVCTRTN